MMMGVRRFLIVQLRAKIGLTTALVNGNKSRGCFSCSLAKVAMAWGNMAPYLHMGQGDAVSQVQQKP